MKNLTEKKKWEIAEQLSQVMDPDTWVSYVTRAGMNRNLVEKKSTNLAQCLSVVNFAIKQDKLLNLLKQLTRDFPDTYDGLLNELETGYSDKLAKLVNNITQGNCILFLGPGVIKINEDNKEKTFNGALTEYLKNELENFAIYFDPEQQDNLTYMVQRYAKTPGFVPGQVGKEAARRFDGYRQTGQMDYGVFEKLKMIPWNLVINTNPDNILAGMQKADTYLERNYTIGNSIDDSIQNTDMDKDADDIEENGKTFFYNLFGTFKDPDSILYTESDFLAFINNVVNNAPKLHSYVTKLFDDKKHYLFIGFDFDQWYFKILAKTLKINKEERALSLNTGLKKFSECNLDFFEQEFKFYFVNDDTNKFLTELVDTYNKLVKK